MKWEDIFANYISNKRYYLGCIKNSQNSTSKNPITQLENEILKKRERKKKENEIKTKDTKSHFTQQGIKITN